MTNSLSLTSLTNSTFSFLTFVKTLTFFILVFLSFSQISHAEIQTEVVQYKADTLTLQGYLAYDDSLKGRRPGVLVVHEWWGHNEYARKRARMLAELGYVAFAIDMYGEGKTTAHPKEASTFAKEALSHAEKLQERFVAAYEYLAFDKRVDVDRVAAIGYCFGGGVVLEMARKGLGLAGVVSFHGSLATENPAKIAGVRSKILVCHGEEDAMVSDNEIQNFIAEMRNADVDYNFITYKDAKHSFTNSDADKFASEFGLPVAYNAEADKKSWEDMKNFLEEVFV